MYLKDQAFKLLQKKEIYEFLEGSGEPLISYKGKSYGMPYYSRPQLEKTCLDFGYTGFTAGSRWEYVEGLLDFAITQGRCDELLKFFLSEERFEQLRELESMDEIDAVYRSLFEAAIAFINKSIKMARKELVYTGSCFHIVDIGQIPVIAAPALHVLDLPYVRSLQERCKSDFLSENYDSVITKSRTLIEEILVKILEDNAVEEIPHTNITLLYNKVKDLYGLKRQDGYDQRVIQLVGSLESIVNAIASMRNVNSDAHGVGSKRIMVRDYEARLIMNASSTLCEYLLSIHERKLSAKPDR